MKLQPIINRINKNCIKNNCDSAGIISVEFNKYIEKDLDYIHLSPTDMDKFNIKMDYPSVIIPPLAMKEM